MLKCEKQLAVASLQSAVKGGKRTVVFCLLLTANCLLLLGCRQDMQDQPRYEVYESSGFFKDGVSSRQLVDGTVPRGFLRADKQLFTGQKDKAAGTSNMTTTAQNMGSSTPPGGNSNSQAATAPSSAEEMQQQPAGDVNDVEDFPFPITAEVLDRGQERYQIFCSMCHGYTGDGDGMIVRRGFRPPPSYHEKRLRDARVGYIFKVITEGYGAMASYRGQIPVQDRWAIIAYVRTLQLSRLNQQPAKTATTPAGASKEPGGHQ